MIQLLIHKEYDQLVPALSDEEFKTLRESIKENGLWMPIIINEENIILDGHHRFRICQELGIETKYAVQKFATKADEMIFVGECNLKRRQLTSLQRIRLVMKLEPFYADKAKQNMQEGGRGGNITTPLGKVRDNLGKKAQVSGRTYEKGTKVLEKATPEDIAKINNGEKTITKVYREIQKTEKKVKREKELKQLQVNLPDTIQIYNQEFQTLHLETGSVSLIFTDPPYHDKYLHLYDDLMRGAYDVLRDGGSIVCYVGQGNIGKVINMAEKYGLKFHWPITILHSGPSASVFGKKVLVSCKIMLWFVKGKYEGEFVRDSIKSEFEGKELHEWAQSTKESDYYIKYMTIPNEIVYDPFLGSGTFGISAKKLGRQFIGCEVDPVHYETARRVISNAS